MQDRFCCFVFNGNWILGSRSPFTILDNLLLGASIISLKSEDINNIYLRNRVRTSVVRHTCSANPLEVETRDYEFGASLDYIVKLSPA